MKTKRQRNKGELAVVVVCAIVGFLLAAQLRTVQLTGAADAASAARLETLQDLYNELTAERDGLAEQVSQLQATVQSQEGTIQSQENTIAQQQAAIQALEAAGTAAELERALEAAYQEGVESNG